jgi:hypothetical protein
MGIKLFVFTRCTAVGMGGRFPAHGARECGVVDVRNDQFLFVDVEAIRHANYLVRIRAVGETLGFE